MATKAQLLLTIEQLRAECESLRRINGDLRAAKAIKQAQTLNGYRAKLKRAREEAMRSGTTVKVH